MSYLPNPEESHRLLYEAHWNLAAAADKLHNVIVTLHSAGRYAEARAKFTAPLSPLEKARDLVDSALRAAGDGRSELIRLTGCDGKCGDEARRGKSVETHNELDAPVGTSNA